MSEVAEQLVESLCAGDLSGLDQVALQATAEGLRGLIGRLTGRLDQVLAELDVRQQPQPASSVAVCVSSGRGSESLELGLPESSTCPGSDRLR